MNNKQQPNMKTIRALAKFLIGAWHTSKCPDNDVPYCCTDCKYNELCAKIEDLEKVVNK